MSIASEVERLESAKSDLKSALESKGVAVPEGAKLNAFPALVQQISVGGEQTVAVAYTVDVPTTGWADGSLTWGGTTYTRQCTVTAADATASPTSVSMSYEGGAYDAYCQVGLIDTQDGSVVLWATDDPTAACQIRVAEVRQGADNQ